MIKPSKPRRQTVQLQPPARPSRIRREPVPEDKPLSLVGRVHWGSREWEIRFAIIGIILFALGINAVVFDIGHLLGQ